METAQPGNDAHWPGWIVPGLFGLAALWVLYGWAFFGPHNIASSATVTASSARTGDPRQLVDGDVETTAIATERERRPSVTLDLGKPQQLDEVIVHRRTDDGPLEIEISVDGEVWGRYARRGGAFDEWTAEHQARARYVRITRTKKGRLELTEVELIAP